MTTPSGDGIRPLLVNNDEKHWTVDYCILAIVVLIRQHMGNWVDPKDAKHNTMTNNWMECLSRRNSCMTFNIGNHGCAVCIPTYETL